MLMLAFFQSEFIFVGGIEYPFPYGTKSTGIYQTQQQFRLGHA